MSAPLPSCPAKDPRDPRRTCSGTGGHNGRHINVNGSWAQTRGQCTDQWHINGRPMDPTAQNLGCRGCGEGKPVEV